MPTTAIGTVVSNSAIEHRFFSEKSLAECIRVLKPGGKLVICLPNTAHWICRLWLLFGRFPYVRNSPHRRDPPALLHRSRGQGAVPKYGVRVVATDGHASLWVRGFYPRPFRWRPVAAVYKRLARIYPSLFARDFIFVCRKEGQAVMSIGRQVSRGVFWVGISTLSTQALAFATSLILMRILPRSDFGMVAMAYIMINALQLFQELGFSQALIYRRDRIREAANTMFVLLFGVSIMLYVVAFIGARPIATFFNANVGSIAERNELVMVIRVLSLSLIFCRLRPGAVCHAVEGNAFPPPPRSRYHPPDRQGRRWPSSWRCAGSACGAWSGARFSTPSCRSIMAWVVSPLRPRVRLQSHDRP